MRKRQAELASRVGDDSAAQQAGDGKEKPEPGWGAEPKHPGALEREPQQEVRLSGCYAYPAFQKASLNSEAAESAVMLQPLTEGVI